MPTASTWQEWLDPLGPRVSSPSVLQLRDVGRSNVTTGLTSVAQVGELAARAHYHVTELAALFKLSTRQLERIFRNHFGHSPQRWLDQQRMVAARAMLLSGKPIKLVAFELGFKQPSHFSRQFKLFNGITPSHFVSGHIQAKWSADVVDR